MSLPGWSKTLVVSEDKEMPDCDRTETRLCHKPGGGESGL